MSERYEIIKEKELTDIWYKDFPIELNKTRLLYDNQTGNVLIQFKLTNVCTKIINTVYLKINCYDVSKTVVDSVEEHVIPMLSVKQNESFGDKAPAVSKDRRTADVNVIITKIVFSDGSVWENDTNYRPIQVHAPEEITFAPHIASRFKSVSGHLPNIRYMFREYDGYWRCTCGRINYKNADICSCCACKREELRNLFSEEYLKELIYQNAKAKMNSDTESEYMTAINILNTIKDYKDSEQLIEECNVGKKECIYKSAVSLIEEDNTFSYESAKKLLIKITDWRNSKELIEHCDTRIQEIHNETEKQKEIQRVAKEKAKKKAKRKAMIICSVVVAVIIGIVLFVILGIPALKRNNAEKLLSEGRYDEGYAIIMELDGQEGVNSHKYERAKVHLNNKEFDKAIEIFTEIGDYSDSSEQIIVCKYSKAVSLMDSGKYEEALAVFEELGDYSDSKTQIEKCVNESNRMKYEKANELLNEGMYQESLDIFDELDNYSDSEEKADEARYNLACAQMSDKDYKNAYENFKQITHYKDGSEKRKESGYEYSKILITEKNYVDAVNILGLIGSYKDTETLVDECYLEAAKQFYEDKKYDKVVTWYEKTTSYDKNAEFYRESCYQSGLNALNDGNMFSAISYFEKSNGYSYSNEKIKEAKYKYILKNKKNTDNSTLTFVKELMAVDYKDSDSLYEEIFGWKLKIIANTSETDETTDNRHFRKNEKIWFHIFVSGGEPNASIDMSYKVIGPFASWSGGWDDPIKSGFHCWFSFTSSNTCSYDLEIYDNNTNTVIGTLEDVLTYN